MMYMLFHTYFWFTFFQSTGIFYCFLLIIWSEKSKLNCFKKFYPKTELDTTTDASKYLLIVECSNNHWHLLFFISFWQEVSLAPENICTADVTIKVLISLWLYMNNTWQPKLLTLTYHAKFCTTICYCYCYLNHSKTIHHLRKGEGAKELDASEEAVTVARIITVLLMFIQDQQTVWQSTCADDHCN